MRHVVSVHRRLFVAPVARPRRYFCRRWPGFKGRAGAESARACNGDWMRLMVVPYGAYGPPRCTLWFEHHIYRVVNIKTQSTANELLLEGSYLGGNTPYDKIGDPILVRTLSKRRTLDSLSSRLMGKITVCWYDSSFNYGRCYKDEIMSFVCDLLYYIIGL